MPFYKTRRSYLRLKEAKLEIMQLIIGKLMRRGLKMRALKLWKETLYIIKTQFITPNLKSSKELNYHKSTFINDIFSDSINLQKDRLIISDQQYAFMEMHHLHSLFNSFISYTPTTLFIYLALDNICPIVLFNKKQKKRHLMYIPVYATRGRDLKLGLTWLLAAARVKQTKSPYSLPFRIFQELLKAYNNATDSELISLKMQYYNLAQKNKKYIQIRRYFL